MMSITHLSIAVAGTAALLGTGDPLALTLAAAGSQIPDLDTTASFAGMTLYPIASALEHRFPHRTITHSFLSTAIVALLAAPLWVLGWQYWAALVLGDFLGWFSDCFTKAGVAAFYPSPVRLVIPGNPKARLRSGTTAEYWVLGLAIALSIIFVNLASAGGVSESFARAFFNDTETAAQLFGKYGSDRSITVDVTGQNTVTSQPVQFTGTVIDAGLREVIAETAGKLYKVGGDGQIQPTSVKAHVGDRLRVTSQTQMLRDIAVSDWVKQLPQNAFISGSLLLDDMESLRLTLPVGEYPTMQAGTELTLRNARPEQITSQLRDFWISQGQVVIKVRG